MAKQSDASSILVGAPGWTLSEKFMQILHTQKQIHRWHRFHWNKIILMQNVAVLISGVAAAIKEID